MMSEILKFYMENFVRLYYVITVMGEKESRYRYLLLMSDYIYQLICIYGYFAACYKFKHISIDGYPQISKQLSKERWKGHTLSRCCNRKVC